MEVVKEFCKEFIYLFLFYWVGMMIFHETV